jgi:hypothetical protein
MEGRPDVSTEDELAKRRARRQAADAPAGGTPPSPIAALAASAYARYLAPPSESDIAINHLSGDWASYALEHGFADLCMVHASPEEINPFLRFGQIAFFAGVVAEREGMLKK